jgi:class 3 adenylate cyclase/predicted ATPase
MSEISELQHAIETLETQRSLLGDAVVNAALAPMRDRLRHLQAQTATEQRRLVTILFADLVDFTMLTRRLDAEDVREIVNAYFTRWTAAIERHGGVVEKFAGDAVMAVFGLLQSTDLDPIQAVRAALTMGRELAVLNQRIEPQYGVQLQMRTGIHTGHAIVSTLQERRGQDFVIVGDSVNLASRLQALAPVNGIVVSHDTLQHVSREFELRAFPPTPIKGFEQPMAYYAVLGERPHVALALDSASALAPLVGRDEVFAALHDAWEQTLAAHAGRLIVLSGGPGLGKSRLLLEFERWVRRRQLPIHLFVGRSLPSLRDTPYSLLRDLFAEQFGIQDSDAPAVVERKLRGAIHSVLPQQADAAALIGRLLGFTPEAAPVRGQVEDPEVLQNQAIARLNDYITALAADRPVVALIEDLHWADDRSLDLLHRLTHRHGGRRLLLVGTARPELGERRPDWRTEQPPDQPPDQPAGAAPVVWIELAQLSAADAGRLLAALLAPAAALPPQLVEQITTAADGNPFFVEEIVKVLIEDGVIDTGVQPWVIDEARLQEARLPQTLAGVLQARLDSLHDDARIALQQAAVVGRVFWDQAVEHLAAAPAGTDGAGTAGAGAAPVAADSTGTDIPAALATLYQRELVFTRAISSFERTQEYLFKHALMRDVAYGSMLRRTRRSYHRLAAQWLEEVTLRSRRSDEFAALIAQHYDTAEEAEAAASWYLQAGRQAARSFANAEALRAFDRAVELLPEQPPAPRYAALAERERVYDLLGRRAEQAADLQQMAALTGGLSDPLAAAETALRRSQLALAQGDYPAALETALAAAAQARRAQNPAGASGVPAPDASGAVALESSALLQHGQILLRQGEYTAALAQMQGAWRLARAAGDRSLQADSLHGQAMAQVFMGEFDAAQASFTAALAEAVAVGNRRLECTLLNRLSWVPTSRNEYALAAHYAGRSLALSREIGDRAAEANALTNLGNCYIQLADFARGEEYTRGALMLYRELGDPGGECATLDNLGNNAWAAGDFAAAIRYKEEALAIARRIGDRQTETNILGNLGIVTSDIGDLAAAHVYMLQALELARQDGNRSIESTVLANLSGLRLWQGQPQEAHAYAAAATDLALELGAQRDRVNALDALGAAYLALGDAAAALAAHREEEALAQQEGLPDYALAASARQAEALLALGNLPAALARVEIVLAGLDRLTPSATTTPAEVFWACCQVLAAAGDPRYPAVLAQAHAWLQSQLARLEDTAHRVAFIDNVPARAALMRAWGERVTG